MLRESSVASLDRFCESGKLILTMRCFQSCTFLTRVAVAATLLSGLHVLSSCSSAPDHFSEDDFTDDETEWVIAGESDDDSGGSGGSGPVPSVRESKTSNRKPAPAPAPAPVSSGRRRASESAPPPERRPVTPTVRGVLERLADKDKTVSMKTFWKLTEIDEEFIPELIDHVEDDRLSSVTEVAILVKYDRTRFRGQLVSRIPGMGRMEEYEKDGENLRVYGREYDRGIRVGTTRNGLKVRIEKEGGFPLGVVVRAALINRFRSVNYPRRVDHLEDLNGWWWAYYRRLLRSGELNLKVPGR